jgi:general secretion pathway protein D
MNILNDIGEFVRKMDTPTSQVLLEGKILEITLTDDFDSFFDFDITPNPARGKHTADLGGFTALDSSTLIYQFVDNQVDVRMELFEKNSQVKVIGTPMILCANNAEGEFFIGEERPITSSYEYEIREYEERTTETVRPVIELKDIGTKLTIIPSINEDRTVTMRFSAEVDTVNAGGADYSLINQEGNVVTLPIDTVDTSRVENIIVASDGSTLAIGGLIREDFTDSESKVPVLGDIPLLGFFFKKKALAKEKTETVFLITPHIMMAPEEAGPVSDKTVSNLSDHPYNKGDSGRLLHYDEKNKKLKAADKETLQGTENLAAEAKDGEVLSVDSSNDFAIISLGKHEGIKIGDIFSVYRQDKYIGTVTVINLRSSVSSVAAINQTRIEEIRVGDEVKVKELSQ